MFQRLCHWLVCPLQAPIEVSARRRVRVVPPLLLQQPVARPQHQMETVLHGPRIQALGLVGSKTDLPVVKDPTLRFLPVAVPQPNGVAIVAVVPWQIEAQVRVRLRRGGLVVGRARTRTRTRARHVVEEVVGVPGLELALVARFGPRHGLDGAHDDLVVKWPLPQRRHTRVKPTRSTTRHYKAAGAGGKEGASPRNTREGDEGGDSLVGRSLPAAPSKEVRANNVRAPL